MLAMKERLPRRSLIGVRTHREADDLIREYRHERRLPLVAYPRRTTRPLKYPIVCPYCGIDLLGPPERGCRFCGGTGEIEGFVSCWNEDADVAQKSGLSPMAAICPDCPFRERCQDTGYLRLNRQATEAQIVVATHARLVHRGFADVSSDRDYISIQEDATGLLRPFQEIRFENLRDTDPVLTLIFNDPRRLDWFGKLEQVGKPKVEAFLRQMARISSLVLDASKSFKDPFVVIPLPEGIQQPPQVEQILWEAARYLKRIPSEPLFAVLKAASAGDLHSLVLFNPAAYDQRKTGKVDSRKTASQKESEPQILAFFSNERPKPATIWFCDASMYQYRLEAVLGEPLTDVIEPASLPPQKRILQIAEDLTQGTTKSKGRKIRQLVREALAMFPDRRNVGVLCHLKHKPFLERLEPLFRARVGKIEHFRGGSDRSSNTWHRECELLIVIGTPRIRPHVIAEELIRLGEYEAARRDGRWAEYKWTGRREDGSEIEVTGLGYGDERWQALQVALVREELRQAVGRARANLPDGIDAIVFSNEDLGYPAAPPSLLSNLTDSVGRLIEELCALFSNRYLYREQCA